MKPADIQELMARAQEAQSRMAELQKKLAARRIEGSAGGGMVKAIATGELRILRIEIEPSLLTSGDRDMIQDLSAAAVNAALTNAQQMIQEEIQRAGSTLSLPNLADLFGSADKT